jgi:type I restriction enzyme S subunit
MELEAGYKRTDVGVIPEDWESTNVSGIASPIRNAIVGGPFGSDLVSNDYVEQGVPVIRGQNMGFKLVSGSFVFVTPAKASSLKSNLAHAGDLVFTQRGTLGQVSLVPDYPFDDYLISQSQMKLTVNREKAYPAFFYYVFRSSEQQQFIRQSTIQTGVPHINLGILRAIPIQRPRLAEQEAIAEALGDADALIESLERLIEKKGKIKQGVMQELLTGKKRLPGFENLFGCKQTEAGVIPRDWEVSTIGHLAIIKTGPFGTLLKASEYSENGVPLISVGEIREGYLKITENTPRVSSAVTRRLPQYLLRTGDIVFGRKGGVQRSVLIRPEQNAWFLGSDGIAIRPTKDCHSAYLAFQFQSARVQEWLLQNAIGTTMPSLNQDILRNLAVPVPPTRAEQECIVAVLNDMDADLAALEGKLGKACHLKQGMMQQLLSGRTRLI